MSTKNPMTEGEALAVEAACAAFARLDGIADWSDPSWQESHQIEAGRLRTRMRAAIAAALREQPEARGVVDDAIRHLSKWLDMAECECESGHQCGRSEVEDTRNRLRALTAAQQPDHIVDATKMVAQQQGQAVAWRSEDERVAVDFYRMNPSAALFDLRKRLLAPPSAPVGVPEDMTLAQAYAAGVNAAWAGGVPGRKPILPSGYALVPVEPTDAMIAELMRPYDRLGWSFLREKYAAMLAAAKQEPST